MIIIIAKPDSRLLLARNTDTSCRTGANTTVCYTAVERLEIDIIVQDGLAEAGLPVPSADGDALRDADGLGRLARGILADLEGGEFFGGGKIGVEFWVENFDLMEDFLSMVRYGGMN